MSDLFFSVSYDQICRVAVLQAMNCGGYSLLAHVRLMISLRGWGIKNIKTWSDGKCEAVLTKNSCLHGNAPPPCYGVQLWRGSYSTLAGNNNVKGD